MTRGNQQPASGAGAPGEQVYHQEISVPFEYPVHFTHDLFDPADELFASVLDRLNERRRHRAAVYVDSGAVEAHPDLLRRIGEYFHAHADRLELAGTPQTVPGGETAKNGWSVVREVMSTIGNLHLDRQSFVVAVGGGAVLDMVGFATSLVHRGLRLVRVPTTVLAQSDGGVGVKNGMDEHGQKNFIGTFAPPFAVLNDAAFLPTLAEDDWIGGVAEAFKVAIIKDAEFFEFLCDSAAALRRRDLPTMEQVIHRTAILHLEHIRGGGDPFEFGSARPLDFGHWAGHRIETMTGFSVGHGQAIAVGIALDSHYAAAAGLVSEGELDRILSAISAVGLPVWHECLRQRTADGELEILEGLREFREHLGGTLCVTLPEGIGSKVEVHHINPDYVERGAALIQARSEEPGPQP